MKIKSQVPNKNYLNNWDKIFNKDKKCDTDHHGSGHQSNGLDGSQEQSTESSTLFKQALK